MKMYKYILESVNDVNLLGLIPLVIFFLFFSGMIIKVLKSTKGHNAKMSELPLEDN